MTKSLRYDPTAAHKLLGSRRPADIETELLAARDTMLVDVEMLDSRQQIPPEKQPLDAGLIRLPETLLGESASGREATVLRQIKSAAAELSEQVDRLVVLGIGGSYMGARALFEALRHPFHNELSARQRNGIPRIYFEGNNLDNDAVGGLLDLLSNPDSPSNSREDRWGIVPISKSGGTLETAVAFRIFRDALERSFGSDSPALKQLVVPITGATGKLRDLATDAGYRHVFEIPDDVGGRFSVFTAVGLFPAAMMGIDVEQLLSGAADMTRRFFSAPLGENPVLDYTATCHLFEADAGMTVRLLSTWGSRLEALGFWYDQLLSESLGKQEKGATPITVVNTRDLHSRGQQHQEGRRDKLITNVIVETPSNDPLKVPKSAIDHDQLNRLHNKTLPELLAAATEGTNQAYAAVERPTADILLAELTPYAMGELLQMFMLATVLEGRLIAINPYGQPGVEAYKQNMTAIIDRG